MSITRRLTYNSTPSMDGASTSGLVGSRLGLESSSPHYYYKELFFLLCLFHHIPVRLSIMSDSSPNIGYNYRFLFILSSFNAGQTHSVLPIRVMSVPCHPTSVDIGGCSSRRIQDSILLVIAFGIMYHSSVWVACYWLLYTSTDILVLLLK